VRIAPTGRAIRKIQLPATKSGVTGIAQETAAKSTRINNPAHLPVWEDVTAATHAAVREFNLSQGSEQFRVSAWPTKAVHMEVVSLPAAHRVATLTLQVRDEYSGELGLTCPPEGEGIGRRGNFRMRDGKIEALPNFVGTPQPPTAPMTAAEFVRFILEPLLFSTN
jgi:hypothetical protein